MKSFKKETVLTLDSLYQFFRSIIYISASIREELAVTIEDLSCPSQELNLSMIEDVQEIENKIFDLLEKLSAIEYLQDETLLINNSTILPISRVEEMNKAIINSTNILEFLLQQIIKAEEQKKSKLVIQLLETHKYFIALRYELTKKVKANGTI